MSKRKEKAAEIKRASTAITKVVATVTDATLAPAAPETTELATEVNADYTAAIENVRAAMADYGRCVWKLAWALVDFRSIHEQLHPNDRLTDKQLKDVLGINVSPARIGQLVNTAKAFPREQVDESIDFRVYEQARLWTQKKPRMTAEKRLELVKKHPTTQAIVAIKPAARAKASASQKLLIHITAVDGDDKQPDISSRFNGASVDLPDELRTAIQKYALKLFTETGAEA